MRKWFGLLGVASVVFVAAVPAFAGHCCKHHGCYCCPAPEPREAPRAAYAPRAAVVDSMPVFQVTPGVVAMPMMMAGFARQVPEERPRSTPKECDQAHDRIDQLEQKVDALDLRMQTIMRSVEIQTRILEEMKAERVFPKRYLPEGDGKTE